MDYTRNCINYRRADSREWKYIQHSNFYFLVLKLSIVYECCSLKSHQTNIDRNRDRDRVNFI